MARLTIIALVVSLAACTADEPEHVAEPRQYSRPKPGYDSIEACVAEAMQAGMVLYDCGDYVELCPDGHIVVGLTDVPAHGTYELVGARVEATFEPGAGAGVPPALAFELLPDSTLAAPDLGGAPFALESTTNVPFCSP